MTSEGALVWTTRWNGLVERAANYLRGVACVSR